MQILLALGLWLKFPCISSSRTCDPRGGARFDPRVLCTYPVIPSFVHVCINFEWFSPVAIFRNGFSFVEYCSGSFRAFLHSDY